MFKNCCHIWREVTAYSKYAHKVICPQCGITKIAKPKIYIDPLELPFAANEFIAYSLIELLRKKGLNINFPNVELFKTNKRFYQDQDLWGYGVALIEDLGNHARITKDVIEANQNIKYPDWLYYFDRWIGRLDGDGDNNLLLINNEAVPVDFNLAFSWNNPAYLFKINNLEVPCHEIIKKNKNEKVLSTIKSLKDYEIFQSFSSIDRDFISTQGIIAYYSGLCLRRDLLY